MLVLCQGVSVLTELRSPSVCPTYCYGIDTLAAFPGDSLLAGSYPNTSCGTRPAPGGCAMLSVRGVAAYKWLLTGRDSPCARASVVRCWCRRHRQTACRSWGAITWVKRSRERATRSGGLP